MFVTGKVLFYLELIFDGKFDLVDTSGRLQSGIFQIYKEKNVNIGNFSSK